FYSIVASFVKKRITPLYMDAATFSWYSSCLRLLRSVGLDRNPISTNAPVFSAFFMRKTLLIIFASLSVFSRLRTNSAWINLHFRLLSALCGVHIVCVPLHRGEGI